MAGNARSKIDRIQSRLFDGEVDKPEHDAILTRLFQDDDTLSRLLTEHHQLEPLGQPAPGADIVVRDSTMARVARMSFAEALERSGKPLRWSSTWPIRIARKQLEVQMNYTSDPLGKYERNVGFVDIGINYGVVQAPYLKFDGGQYRWALSKLDRLAIFEIKGVWPTVGNLIRQLNLYRVSRPVLLTEAERHNFVVGPDDTVGAFVHEHNYRLITFDAAGTDFRLVPKPSTSANHARGAHP